MGRIKTTQIKQKTIDILDKFPGIFSTKYEENKAIIQKYCAVPSKKLRNILAGSIGKTIKKREF